MLLSAPSFLLSSPLLSSPLLSSPLLFSSLPLLSPLQAAGHLSDETVKAGAQSLEKEIARQSNSVSNLDTFEGSLEDMKVKLLKLGRVGEGRGGDCQAWGASKESWS